MTWEQFAMWYFGIGAVVIFAANVEIATRLLLRWILWPVAIIGSMLGA